MADDLTGNASTDFDLNDFLYSASDIGLAWYDALNPRPEPTPAVVQATSEAQVRTAAAVQAPAVALLTSSPWTVAALGAVVVVIAVLLIRK